MSDLYIQRLRAIQSEFNASRQSLAFIERNWQRLALGSEFDRTGPRDLALASRNVEATYFIRLFAEFEGVLKDHLATNHRRARVSDKPKVDQLITRVVQVEALTIDPMLRRKMDAVRDYRNSIAHQKRNPAPTVTLTAALSTLNTFVSKLPDPLT